MDFTVTVDNYNLACLNSFYKQKLGNTSYWGGKVQMNDLFEHLIKFNLI